MNHYVTRYLVWPALLLVAVSQTAQSMTADDDLCEKNVVVTGYWPPTNEMLRLFSTDPVQNPVGWQGQDWHGHGFDVYSYFPEFPPDGDPFDDTRGTDEYIGSSDSDFRVDYQDTSADFWRIVDEKHPLILITTSWGSGAGWEVEAREGGHDNPADMPELDWSTDYRGPPYLPTSDTIDPRSWSAISTYRDGNFLESSLPMDEIIAAVDALGITDVAIDNDTSGNYLSGFMALHGVYYNHIKDHNVAAGHIHVNGSTVDPADARVLIEATLEAVLGHFDVEMLRPGSCH